MVNSEIRDPKEYPVTMGHAEHKVTMVWKAKWETFSDLKETKEAKVLWDYQGITEIKDSEVGFFKNPIIWFLIIILKWEKEENLLLAAPLYDNWSFFVQYWPVNFNKGDTHEKEFFFFIL